MEAVDTKCAAAERHTGAKLPILLHCKHFEFLAGICHGGVCPFRTIDNSAMKACFLMVSVSLLFRKTLALWPILLGIAVHSVRETAEGRRGLRASDY